MKRIIYQSMTISRLRLLFLLLVLAFFMPGCAQFGKKKPKTKIPETKAEDQNPEVAFESFMTRLKQAAKARNRNEMANLMTPNFGYSWEPGGEGRGVFEYWDRMSLWPELELVLQEKFVPSGAFMVAPAQATYDSNYRGYRAGMRQFNGAWHFVYFVSAPPEGL
jgi:hypothetical protein